MYENRGSARQRGYTYRWEKARARYLREHPLCRMCLGQGKVTAATVVDHIIPHRGDETLFWDRDNWQPLCKPCHDAEKQSEERLGYSVAIGADGWPVDPMHPANGGKPQPAIGNSMTHPGWFRPVYVPLTIVCGAPGSGKSTYVNTHAGPSDRIICFDRIASKLFGSDGGQRAHTLLDGKMIRDVLRQRNEELGDLMRAAARNRWPAAWLIVSEPKPERRDWWQNKVKPRAIVVMQTPADECKRRVRADAQAGDKRHGSVEQSIDRWWRDYRPRKGDVLIH